MTASGRIASRLRQILEGIEAIRRYSAEMTFETYVADRRICDAVERNLERISEASRPLFPTRSRPGTRVSTAEDSLTGARTSRPGRAASTPPSLPLRRPPGAAI
ncbi:MAG: HepT-like ribonuclease domain-containing protein [Pseudomonadota bacterium]